MHLPFPIELLQVRQEFGSPGGLVNQELGSPADLVNQEFGSPSPCSAVTVGQCERSAAEAGVSGGGGGFASELCKALCIPV